MRLPQRIVMLMVMLALAGTMVWAEETNTPPLAAGGKRERAPLTDEQKAQMEQRANEAWAKLGLREKQQLLRVQRALREMPANERKFIHERIERFLNMTPEERQKLRENADRWQKMTPEERQQAREKFQQQRRTFEEQWRKEHPGEEPPPFPYHKHRPAPPADESSPKPTSQP